MGKNAEKSGLITERTVREILERIQVGRRFDSHGFIRKVMQMKPREYAIGLGRFASDNLAIYDPINHFHLHIRDCLAAQTDLVTLIGTSHSPHPRSGIDTECELWERADGAGTGREMDYE